MKLSTQIASAAAIVAAGLTAETTEAREAVVILSPVGSVEGKMTEIEAVALHLIESVEPGEQAWVVNGLTQEQIAHYALNNDPERYGNQRNRVRDNAPFFRDLKTFAETAIPPKEDVFLGKIDLPSTLRTINANYPASEARDLILYGVSPVTHDPRHLDWSMLDGVIPDDDHFAASRADTPYGASGEGNYLHNYAVHWGMNGTDWSVSDRHVHFMLRYVSQSITSRSGSLATFAPDPATALRNAKEGIAERVGPFTPERDGHRTMVHFRPTAGLDAGDAGGSIYERTLSQRAPDVDELRAAQNIEIAIRWDCACDFDLAVQVWGDDPISFRAPRGVSGTLFKDFTSSASLNTAWETVAMPGPVDLQALTIAVNQFSGASGGAEAELRIAIDGETWGRKLAFAGPADRGAGFERTLSRRAPANPAWLVVRPVDVVGGN
ncbi:hypothetical protein [uncultured Roseobacter sp.]|uniref:hypothetical protein n=1 Tax=uncultured Roseobacter sp. TaxID=114847 RepID=UPI00261DECBD|nr:hypothetical protein [uncultured Roseobacter sp.]